MLGHGAAAEGGTSAHGNISRGSAATIAQPWDTLPSVLAERLCAAGILTAEDWRRLGVRRRQIFGITRKMCEEVDSAVAALLTRGRP
jgi:hypothetical protein